MTLTDETAPRVTVVIPTCNRCEVLHRCLTALSRQTMKDFEVIVVDDASNDDTPNMLERFAIDHPTMVLRLLRNDSHRGANPSRNRGVREARGEFVAFEDSDCIAEPTWLEHLVEGFTHDSVAAVTGLVQDIPPTNIFELTFKGTHRAAKSGHAHRLVAGNMCIRRDCLAAHHLDEDRVKQPMKADGTPDVSVSGRGDEEGLYHLLRSEGYDILAVEDAVVLHEHHYNARSFFRQAFRGGRSAARLVYKYYLPPRLDLLPFMLAYLTCPMLLVDFRLAWLPGLFMVAALAALIYNDLFRKRKSVVETIITFPVLMCYYQVRLTGYVLEAVALRLGLRRIERLRLPRRSNREIH